MNAFLKYAERVGIAISILLNVILGGPSNQTFSARNYYWKMHDQPNIVWLIDMILWRDPEHCLHCWIYYKTTKDLRRTHISKLSNINLPKNLYDSDFIDQ